MRISKRDAQGERDIYDSECMARDVADAIDATMNAEIGETFDRSSGHAFNVVTPHGRKFLVTVTEVDQPADTTLADEWTAYGEPLPGTPQDHS